MEKKKDSNMSWIILSYYYQQHFADFAQPSAGYYTLIVQMAITQSTSFVKEMTEVFS